MIDISKIKVYTHFYLVDGLDWPKTVEEALLMSKGDNYNPPRPTKVHYHRNGEPCAAHEHKLFVEGVDLLALTE